MPRDAALRRRSREDGELDALGILRLLQLKCFVGAAGVEADDVQRALAQGLLELDHGARAPPRDIEDAHLPVDEREGAAIAQQPAGVLGGPLLPAGGVPAGAERAARDAGQLESHPAEFANVAHSRYDHLAGRCG